MTETDLTSVESHFAFGKNWANFAQGIDQKTISEADAGLLNLIGAELIKGASFLDIGCGSGLHALSATRLLASRVVAIDIDPDSVATTRALLGRHAQGKSWDVRQQSILEADSELGQFDIVYSWGVLHHTGDLGKAMREAARHVAPNGIFVFALYRRTRLDSFWIAEKRWYSTASPTAQSCARALYRGVLRLGLLATGRNYRTHRETYRSRRGMSIDHDIHDWLGGYPYESISANESKP